MEISRHPEIERKYLVDAATVIPELRDVGGVSRVSQPVEWHLDAVYFDTTDLVLTAHKTTLRRRTGGDDDGWHLKLPVGGDERTEVRAPLEQAGDTVPRSLLEPVRAVVRDRPLVPIARISTRRREHSFVGEAGGVLARLCDDEVRAERLVGSENVQGWREWEIELDTGDMGVLDALEPRLLAAGAVRSPVKSKLARALGDAAPPAAKKPSRKRLARGSAAGLLTAHLSEHAAQLQNQDARLRADEADSVHKMRIAARRLRSALTTYRPLFESGTTIPLREELRWLGQTLSAARDAQVLREHLDALLAAEPPELVLGPVARRIDDELSVAYQAGRREAVAALDSDRYFRLLSSLEELTSSPPLTPRAQAPARDVVPRLLERDRKRLRSAAAEVERASSPTERDLALHEARKKAKRLRYAAESAAPLFGKRAKRLAASAKNVQDALGEHQDAVVARHLLREYAVQAHLSGENAFTFGRLHALEQARAEHAESDFAQAWSKLPHKNLRNWIRR